MAKSAETLEDGEAAERNARRANPIDASVGGRVRLRRMVLGMSQERLAEKLGLTFQQVQKYEKGINRIGASRLFELAQLLGVSVEFFYADVMPGTEQTELLNPGFAENANENYIVNFLNSREGLELNRAFMKISDPKVRRSIIDLAKSLASEADGSAERDTPAAPTDN